MERYPMTPDGLKKLEAELKKLREVDRPANVKAIEEARGLGDLSENADYKCAKDEQDLILARIAHLRSRISYAAVIDPKTMSGNKVVFGAKVSFKKIDTGEVFVYRLVGEDEADIQHGLISITSPIARGLIRREAGERVDIVTPAGTNKFEIIKIEF